MSKEEPRRMEGEKVLKAYSQLYIRNKQANLERDADEIDDSALKHQTSKLSGQK